MKSEEFDYVLSPQAVRDGAERMLARVKAGQGLFLYHPEKLPAVIDLVVEVSRKNYPTLEIPFHSRLRHFGVGGVDRVAALDQKLGPIDKMERARVIIDLVVPSVLLDAGAGATWKFQESGQWYSRSEGLGVASFALFASGALSAQGSEPKTEAVALQRMTVSDLERAFQVSAQNPLVGVEGRLGLLNQLAIALQNRAIFKEPRPGALVDYLDSRFGPHIPARGILRAVLDGFGSIWPGRIRIDGKNLGDVWEHRASGERVAFHKLSQWMSYSLMEPLMQAGYVIEGLDELTGLAEYRNGGLMLDSGLISLKNSTDADRAHYPDEDLIIEWRALTVALLDLIGAGVQKALGKSAEEFPLVRVLEGGTWWAGRKLASERRALGDPPLQMVSDGTVF